ncbi:hypothetical protein PISL3812_06135 [Talaromyces islandicus]|uniref:Uncharacterized protein n=1 Tax=Talaromyces islandicus TaxID=28573 RepID=A0A0U1M253_TALIS|nr:hypothetical protein PISL3812_06135 [Talaromyces islandicus]
MSSNISLGLIVLITIVTAGAAVTIGFSIVKMFGCIEDEKLRPMDREQEQYMREVRTRNQRAIYWHSGDVARASHAETERTNLPRRVGLSSIDGRNKT